MTDTDECDISGVILIVGAVLKSIIFPAVSSPPTGPSELSRLRRQRKQLRVRASGSEAPHTSAPQGPAGEKISTSKLQELANFGHRWGGLAALVGGAGTPLMFASFWVLRELSQTQIGNTELNGSLGKLEKSLERLEKSNESSLADLKKSGENSLNALKESSEARLAALQRSHEAGLGRMETSNAETRASFLAVNDKLSALAVELATLKGAKNEQERLERTV